MNNLFVGVDEALIKAGWTPPKKDNSSLRDVLLQLIEEDELDNIFQRSAALWCWAEEKFGTHLSEFSDEQIRYEYLERGNMDYAEQIRKINWRRSVGLDVSGDIEDLLNQPE